MHIKTCHTFTQTVSDISTKKMKCSMNYSKMETFISPLLQRSSFFILSEIQHEWLSVTLSQEVNTNVIYMIEINYREQTLPPSYGEFTDDSECEPLFFNNGCNPAHTTCQDYTQPKSPSAASHGCVLQIDSLWEIIKTRCSFLMDNSLQKSAQGIANSSTILP